jgi:hypothetical protein
VRDLQQFPYADVRVTGFESLHLSGRNLDEFRESFLREPTCRTELGDSAAKAQQRRNF